MSDVWQGPGWWLASDGKWYPAEAESGAVVDETTADDVGNVSTADPEPTPADVTVEAEPVEAVAERTSGWQVDDTVDDQAAGTAEQWSSDSAFDPALDDLDAEGLGSVEVTDAVTVQETQIVTTVAEAVVISADDASTVDAPDSDIDTSDIDTGSIDTGSIEPVDFEAPEVEVPDIEVPEVEIPTFEAPEVEIPDIEVPEVEIPTFEAPEVEIPDIEIPEALVGDELPEIELPDSFDLSGIDLEGATDGPDLIDGADLVDGADIEIPEFTVPETLSSAPFDTAPPIDTASLDAASLDAASMDSPLLGAELDLGEAPEALSADTDTPGISSNELDQLRSELLGDVPPKIEIPDPPSNPASSIERTDAWRSPSQTDSLHAGATAAAGRPEVVDLTPPDHGSAPEVPSSGRDWNLVGGAIGVILLIVAIIWLASVLFSNGESTDTSNDAVETTAQSEVAEQVDEAGIDETFVSVFDLRQGDCIIGDIAGQIMEVERVDCEESHDFEVYIERLIDDSVITEYDETVITEFSEAVCRSALSELASPDENPSLNFKFLQPTQDSWNSDAQDRLVTCLGFDEEGPLEGSIGDE